MDNVDMLSKTVLHVGITSLSSIQVAHKLCVFPASLDRPFKKINETFHALREWVVNFGLDPDTLLHIGMSSLDDKVLVTYDCCIEFPLPIQGMNNDVDVKSLPGGTYAILRIEKKPSIISKSIRQFQSDYIPENQLVVDENRPIYEIYYVDTMEYCVPIVG
jgi:DNA gyrase inhibitor GyrI